MTEQKHGMKIKQKMEQRMEQKGSLKQAEVNVEKSHLQLPG